MPERIIDQDDILDMIACSEQYGFTDDVLISGLVKWARPISQADVDRFCEVTPERMSQGYSDEDSENWRETLSAFIEQYGGFDE